MIENACEADRVANFGGAGGIPIAVAAFALLGYHSATFANQKPQTMPHPELPLDTAPFRAEFPALAAPASARPAFFAVALG